MNILEKLHLTFLRAHFSMCDSFSMRGKFLFLLLIILLQSCSGGGSALVRTWIYNDQLERQEEIDNMLVYGGTKDDNLTGSNFIDLQENGTFTSYLAQFDSGKWHFRDSSLILVDYHKNLLELEIKKVNGRELICIGRDKRKVYRFTGYKNNFSSDSINPFSAVNNWWRFKPSARESDNEISLRLKNHFHFWQTYFSWAEKNKVKMLDVSGTPSVLQIFGNGYRMFYYSEQEPRWQNCFYDSADSWKAYEKAYYILATKRVKWPGTKNRFHEMAEGFRQMQTWFDE
jgi:hypothetical protein